MLYKRLSGGLRNGCSVDRCSDVRVRPLVKRWRLVRGHSNGVDPSCGGLPSCSPRPRVGGPRRTKIEDALAGFRFELVQHEGDHEPVASSRDW